MTAVTQGETPMDTVHSTQYHKNEWCREWKWSSNQIFFIFACQMPLEYRKPCSSNALHCQLPYLLVIVARGATRESEFRVPVVRAPFHRLNLLALTEHVVHGIHIIVFVHLPHGMNQVATHKAPHWPKRTAESHWIAKTTSR